MKIERWKQYLPVFVLETHYLWVYNDRNFVFLGIYILLYFSSVKFIYEEKYNQINPFAFGNLWNLNFWPEPKAEGNSLTDRPEHFLFFPSSSSFWRTGFYGDRFEDRRSGNLTTLTSFALEDKIGNPITILDYQYSHIVCSQSDSLKWTVNTECRSYRTSIQLCRFPVKSQCVSSAVCQRRRFPETSAAE